MFHLLSLILFLFCSYIFAFQVQIELQYLSKLCSSVVEITPHLVGKLFFDIYLLITVHLGFPSLDKKFFVLISALIVLILFLFPSKSHCSFEIFLIKNEGTVFCSLSFQKCFFLFHPLTCIFFSKNANSHQGVALDLLRAHSTLQTPS